MLDFFIAAIIAPSDCSEAFDASAKDSYVNYQLQSMKDSTPVRFRAEIPAAYHEHIRASAEASGWSVSIVQVPDPMYPAWKTCYEFVFSSK